MDSPNNILNKTISSDTFIEIFSENVSSILSSEAEQRTPQEYESDGTGEVNLEETLEDQILNYVYNKKSEYELMYTPFWEAFILCHNTSLTPIELKMLFFMEILPNYKRSRLTIYQKKYFSTLYDFYKDFDLEKLRTNDPVAGIHYNRADDNDTFLMLLNRPDVNIIGVTENVNYDIYSEANLNRLFQMNESLRLLYSAFLRNADEIQNNIILEQSEITTRLRRYFADKKSLPQISEIMEILKSMESLHTTPSSSVLMNYSRTSSRIVRSTPNSQTPSSTHSVLDSQTALDTRAELSKYFNKISGRKERKKTPNRKTLRKMQDSLSNTKLKENKRKTRARRQRFRRYLNMN